jgi:hypothetical protein
VGLACPANVGAQEEILSDLDHRYKQLERFEEQALVRGTNEHTARRLKETRDFFLSQGDEGARFLIAKVEQLNEEERRVTKGDEFSADWAIYLFEHGRSPIIRGTVCLILADLYSSVSADAQAAILKTLVRAFTPSERYFHSNPIEWALARLGPAAVPGYLELADHSNQTMRCHFADVLNKLVLKAASSQAPPLTCEASKADRKRAISEWQQWWQEHGDEVPFPEVPSFFDIGSNRGSADSGAADREKRQ